MVHWVKIESYIFTTSVSSGAPLDKGPEVNYTSISLIDLINEK